MGVPGQRAKKMTTRARGDARCRDPPAQGFPPQGRKLRALRGQRWCHCEPQGRDEGVRHYWPDREGVRRLVAPYRLGCRHHSLSDGCAVAKTTNPPLMLVNEAQI